MQRLALTALVFVGCLPSIPTQKLDQPTPIAVGYLVDPTYSGGASTAPQPLKDAIAFELAKHNLTPVEVPLEPLAAQKLTDARFEALKKAPQAEGAPFQLLVELRVHFFSQIDGRYRWEVGINLTSGRADGAMARDPFEIPVILMFDHEKQPEAIVYAKDDIARRVGVLMDGLLAGAPPPVAPAEAK